MKILKSLTLLLPILFASVTYGQDSAAKFNNDTNCMVRYNYYPNLEAYFDNQTNVYYYKQNGDWITNIEIPAGYKGYSLYKMANVAIRDYDDDNILQFASIHKKKYPYNNNPKGRKNTAYTD